MLRKHLLGALLMMTPAARAQDARSPENFPLKPFSVSMRPLAEPGWICWYTPSVADLPSNPSPQKPASQPQILGDPMCPEISTEGVEDNHQEIPAFWSLKVGVHTRVLPFYCHIETQILIPNIWPGSLLTGSGHQIHPSCVQGKREHVCSNPL